jgi:HSP20 family protein
MFGYSDFNRTIHLMEQLRRRMENAFEELDAGETGVGELGTFPRTNVYDTGKGYLFEMEVPGLSEKDINITLTQDVLTVSGERKADAPEGYAVHRQERLPYRFSRSYRVPARVNPDQCSATVKDGILSVTLEKAAEVQPRQISVKVN